MKGIKLTDAEYKLAELIWDNAPISSADLVALSTEKFNWKKSTTYTVLRFLSNKGLFVNEFKTVSVLMTKAEYHLQEGCEFLEEAYDGSLSAFVAAFCESGTLGTDEAQELWDMVKSRIRKKKK